MILVTGCGGFIGSHLVNALPGSRDKPVSVIGCDPAYGSVSADAILEGWGDKLEAVFHLGAISDTTCEDTAALIKTNFELSRTLAKFCRQRAIPFIYASSASVYGNGDGPLNDYASIKLKFDQWIEHASMNPGDWAPWYGLRFFNVYGPGEDHKGKQASLVSQMMRGHRTLFDVEATRDFVHVDDVVSVMLHMWKARPASGIYDVGTGVARDFRDIAAIICPKDWSIARFPDSLYDRYQFHTQADLTKLRAAGYSKPFLSLEEGIARMTK